jgi:hypothetical protein
MGGYQINHVIYHTAVRCPKTQSEYHPGIRSPRATLQGCFTRARRSAAPAMEVSSNLETVALRYHEIAPAYIAGLAMT